MSFTSVLFLVALAHPVLAQIPADLALLEKSDKPAYERLRKTLRDALDYPRAPP